MNVRAAFIHVVGDLIQSVGVCIAAIIIYFRPDWKLADPICTYLFSVLVLISTLHIIKDCMLVFMESTPVGVDTDKIEDDLRKVNYFPNFIIKG